MRRLDYIAHHGILGMHWGVRRTPAQLGHPTPEPRKLESGKTGDYKNDGETVKQTYGKGKTRMIQSRNGETPKKSKAELKRDYRIAADKIAQKHSNIDRKYESNKLKLVDDHFKAKSRVDRDKNRLDQEKNEKNMAVEHYKVIKEWANAKANLQRELHGENSLRYKMAKKRVERAVEQYGDYTITKSKDGHYRVDYQHLEGYQNANGHYVSSSTYRHNIGDSSAASGRGRQAANEFLWNQYLNHA